LTDSTADLERLFKAEIVELILSGNAEEALERLGKHYGVQPPRLRVGVVKGRSRSAGVYAGRKRTIFISNGGDLRNPYLILHEFYHHLRTRGGEHRGTEKHANRFAAEFVAALESRNG